MTRTDPESTVRVIGPSLPYEDGSEAALLEIVAGAADRSTASDELAAAVRDWPTRYHLSRARAHLLRPLQIHPGLRVLDVGAGTGALARYLGEKGARVVALEGTLPRARVAAARCADLPTVEVVSGPLEMFADDEGFDLVLAVGVLEYAGAAIGGGGSPEAFLARLGELTREDGAVVVAIENRLGLKYLLGYAEDHLGEPWIGVEGYPGETGIRTYARRELAHLLAHAGLGHTRWLYPFPDYKLPRVILTERAYELDDACLVDQLVGKPVEDHAHPRALLVDDRTAHRSFVEAGLGHEVANSFLVVAGRSPAGPERFVDANVVAWHFGHERLREWLRVRVVRETTEGLVVQGAPVTTPPRARTRGWLTQHVPERRPYLPGPTVEQLARRALERGDLVELRRVLTLWRGHLLSLAKPREPGPPSHPFLLDATTSVLPPDHFDVNLGNFVVNDDETLSAIDTEWELAEGADVDLVSARALWYFAEDLVTSGLPLPWSDRASVEEITVSLGALCDLALTPQLLEAWYEAEDALQHKVLGLDPDSGRASLRMRSHLSRATLPVTRRVPYSRLQREVVRLRRELDAARAELEPLRARAEEFEDRARELALAHHRIRTLEDDLTGARRLTVELSEQLAGARHELAAACADADATRRLSEERAAEIERWKARWESLERRWPMRLARFILRRPYRG